MTGPTKRDLEKRVADLRGPADLPTAGIITILANEHNTGSFEWIDREQRIALIGGQRYRVMDSALRVADA